MGSEPGTSVQAEQLDERWRWFSGISIGLLAVALAKLALHLYAARFYGYFVDELYFIACSKHLAWGYVDQPPLIALIVRIERILFGDSLQSIRLFAGLAGALNVVLAGVIAREFGGRRFAQVLAGICVLTAPLYLSMNHYISMNAFEPLFWMTSALILIRIIKTGNQKLWLFFGVVAGIGLENKYGMGFFGAGVVLGLLLTEHRRMFLKPWIWLGGVIALALFLPNIIWNYQHQFPFLELMRNIQRSGRNVQMSHWQFIYQQVQLMLTQAAPVWIAGLGYLLFHSGGKRFRALAIAYFFVLAAFMYSANGRPYYVAPAYPMLFAAGAVLLEGWLVKPWLRWVGVAYAGVIVIFGALAAPLALPILPVETYIRYTRALGIEQPRIENWQLGVLPQFYADMHGWEEMTAVVARAYNNLPVDVRKTTAIFGGNFGQAGAIDLFGKKYGLPDAIGTHQNYYFWGPREYTGESVIMMGARYDELQPLFESVEEVGSVGHPYAMPYEHFKVYHCRNSRRPLQNIWPQIKNWR